MYKIKTIYKLIFLLPQLFITPQISAQDLDWNEISFGGFFQFTATEGDLSIYWGNFLSPGAVFQYKINQQFQFEAGISGSFLKPFEKYRSEMPDIVFINSNAGIKYYLITAEYFQVNISPGITNSTFIFTGAAADKAEDNFIEHEFGVYISPGFELKIKNEIWMEFFFGQQYIFSSPDYLILYTFGIKLIFR